MHKSLTLVLAGCALLSSTPALAKSKPTEPTPLGPDLRLALDRVELYSETNKMDDAFALVNKLKQQYPNNPEVLEAEADLNLRMGNRGAGFAALNKAMALDPGNENILDRQRAAIMSQASFVGAGYRYRNTHAAREHFTSLSAQAAASSSVTARIEVENDQLDTKVPITRASGATQDFSDDRQRGSLTFGKTYGSGDEAYISVYAANQVFGAGGQYSHWDMQGATGIEANIHKPDWTYIEMVIGGGSRDNIRLQRKQIITSNLQATLGGGYNRYNLDDITGVANAGAWDLNLAYTMPYSYSGKHKDEITFGAYYTIDAEYFTHVEDRLSGATVFRPLPTSSYEIHAINLSVSKSFTNNVYAEAFGGYGHDRLGDGGPLFGAAIEYALTDHVGLELRGFRTLLGGQQDSEKEDQIAVNLKWRW
jgi:hypothetical protein